jgi:hypothetical protein
VSEVDRGKRAREDRCQGGSLCKVLRDVDVPHVSSSLHYSSSIVHVHVHSCSTNRITKNQGAAARPAKIQSHRLRFPACAARKVQGLLFRSMADVTSGDVPAFPAQLQPRSAESGN